MNLGKTEVDSLYKVDDGMFVFARKENEVSEYKKRRHTMEAKEKEINDMKQQINTVGVELSAIKEMLQILIQKVDK